VNGSPAARSQHPRTRSHPGTRRARPGSDIPSHWHPGEEIIYVLEGSLEYQIEGNPRGTLKAGDVFFIPARAIHTAKNLGSGNGAELATYVVEKGKPLVVVVQ